MLNGPFSPWPSYTVEEANRIQQVLLSNKVNYWTGIEGREFEKEFAEYTDSKYAIAVANGTVAIDLAFKELGLRHGDEVIVTPRSFMASASCIVTAGAKPVFCDVDIDTQNITADTIKSVLSPKTKAVLVVHLAGMPADMDPIMELAEENNFYVVEDCAQAHGARYKGRSVGSIGHIGAWSFCQDKIMTTGGEGGMVTTNCQSRWKSMWAYKDHGKSYDAVYNRKHPPGFRWLHESFGTNWRLTEMQSAIGRIQLRKMNEWHDKRVANASRLQQACDSTIALRTPKPSAGIVHAYYKFYTFVRPEMLAQGWDRDKVLERINQLGVPCMQGSCSEIYMEKAFEQTGFRPRAPLPNAKALGENSIMFMVHPSLTEQEIDKTCDVIVRVMKEATR